MAKKKETVYRVTSINPKNTSTDEEIKKGTTVFTSSKGVELTITVTEPPTFLCYCKGDCVCEENLRLARLIEQEQDSR